jgi:hypothetical protein
MGTKHRIGLSWTCLTVCEYCRIKTSYYIFDTFYLNLGLMANNELPLTKLYISLWCEFYLNTLSYLLSIICIPSATLIDYFITSKIMKIYSPATVPLQMLDSIPPHRDELLMVKEV